jgi:hypothetical protein
MATTDWQEIYSTYSTAELQEEITGLKKLAIPLMSQQVGSKSYTKDLREIRDRLQAAIRMLHQGSAGSYNDNTAVPDFSAVRF